MRIVKGCPSTSMDDYQLNTTTIIRHAARNFPEQEIVYRNARGFYRDVIWWKTLAYCLVINAVLVPWGAVLAA